MAVELNSTIPLLEPISNEITRITTLISSVLGGIVGLTVVMTLLRFYETRQIKKFIKELRADFRNLENKLDSIEKKIKKRAQ